jgi:hypothetical protein
LTSVIEKYLRSLKISFRSNYQVSDAEFHEIFKGFHALHRGINQQCKPRDSLVMYTSSTSIWGTSSVIFVKSVNGHSESEQSLLFKSDWSKFLFSILDERFRLFGFSNDRYRIIQLSFFAVQGRRNGMQKTKHSTLGSNLSCLSLRWASLVVQTKFSEYCESGPRIACVLELTHVGKELSVARQTARDRFPGSVIDPSGGCGKWPGVIGLNISLDHNGDEASTIRRSWQHWFITKDDHTCHTERPGVSCAGTDVFCKERALFLHGGGMAKIWLKRHSKTPGSKPTPCHWFPFSV